VQAVLVLTIQRDVTEGGCLICRPVGDLESFTVSQFREALAEMADGSCLVIDLSGVPFIDSAGLGAVIGGIRRTRERGGRVAVACSRPTLVRLLRNTGFDRIVTVAGTVEAAEESLEVGVLDGDVVIETRTA
jgi:anti-sigma B factor antagonist